MGINFSILCAGAAYEAPQYCNYPYEQPSFFEAQACRHVYRKPDAAISPGDVYALHRMLSSIGLPTELVLYIVQLAGYRAPVKTCREDPIGILYMWTKSPRENLARLYPSLPSGRGAE